MDLHSAVSRVRDSLVAKTIQKGLANKSVRDRVRPGQCSGSKGDRSQESEEPGNHAVPRSGSKFSALVVGCTTRPRILYVLSDM